MGTIRLNRLEDLVGHQGIIAVQETGDLVDRAEIVIQETYEEHEIPLERNKVQCVKALTNKTGVEGMCVAMGADLDKVGKRYVAYEKPREYTICIEENNISRSKESFEGVVRHELAHAINYEVDGYTLECSGNHEEWLRRFGCQTDLFLL